MRHTSTAKSANPMTDPDPAESASAPAPSKASFSARQRPNSLLQSMRNWLRSSLGGRHDSSLKEVIEDAIEEHAAEAEEQLAPEEKIMLHNVLSFGDTTVSEIMIPRTDIVAVAHDITMPVLKAHIIEQRHTRIPVFEDTLDRVLGFIHVKDLLPMLAGDKPFSIRSVMRNLLFVPPSMKIIDLLIKMRHAGSHMAIVVDEYGGTDGLVTMENVFEEIVGDIQDEHDDDEEPEDKITRVGEGVYEVNARIRIEKLEKDLGLNLMNGDGEGEFETLGGLIFFQLGRVPAQGDKVTHVSGVRFEIIEADPRRIHKVRILTVAE